MEEFEKCQFGNIEQTDHKERMDCIIWMLGLAANYFVGFLGLNEKILLTLKLTF